MRVTQAPWWKLMTRVELKRFFERLIIQAPKRNSKWHKEMRQFGSSRGIFGRTAIGAPRVTTL